MPTLDIAKRKATFLSPTATKRLVNAVNNDVARAASQVENAGAEKSASATD